jgi:hypothetical protein
MQIKFTDPARQAAWDRFWDEMYALVREDIAAKVRKEREEPAAKPKRRTKKTT